MKDEPLGADTWGLGTGASQLGVSWWCPQPSSSPPSTLLLPLMSVSFQQVLRLIFPILTARFLQQMKAECHFFNGTEQVWHVTRYIFNQEEILLFDSDVGEFRAVSELGRPIAEYLNSQKDILDNYRAAVDRCRNNYALVILMSQRRVKPKVTVYPTKTLPLQHHNLLVCAVSGFYPGHIEVRWFRNGQEEQSGVVSTGLIQNGDWTFQTLVMLEAVPQSGEVYTCQVEHPSLPGPVTVEWRPQSESAWNKMLSGVGIFALGLLFLGDGHLLHL
uniref:Ig-like domain-containing protein n=1 Tax=Spermophilus dauricus TaxID=99837 RepID=A0A8C9QVI2_SPEDA